MSFWGGRRGGGVGVRGMRGGGGGREGKEKGSGGEGRQRRSRKVDQHGQIKSWFHSKKGGLSR